MTTRDELVGHTSVKRRAVSFHVRQRPNGEWQALHGNKIIGRHRHEDTATDQVRAAIAKATGEA